MSKILPIGILQHYFLNHDPANTKSLKETINHFHMKDLEATDYRSAYHQFSDWLYGWSVSDGADQMDIFNTRQPREIIMTIERETLDAQRLMKTFETLTSLSLRQLKVCYSDIEQEMPRLGQGLDTYSVSKRTDYDDEDLRVGNNVEKVWGDRLPEQDQGESKEATDEITGHPELQFEDSVMQTGSKKGSMSGQQLLGGSQPLVSKGDGMYESIMQLNEDPVVSRKGSFQFLAKSSSEPKVALERENSEKSDVAEVPLSSAENPPTDEPIKALRRDIDHVFREVDQCCEYTLVAMSSIAAVLSFAELLGDKEAFTKSNLIAHEISQGFVSNTMKTIWDLLNRELPFQTTLAILRDPTEFKTLMQQMIALRAVDGVIPKLKIRKLHHKIATIHELFVLVDIHLFPNFANVHKEGISF
jgi:hypothetical protein